jgi:hypothetical protein
VNRPYDERQRDAVGTADAPVPRGQRADRAAPSHDDVRHDARGPATKHRRTPRLVAIRARGTGGGPVPSAIDDRERYAACRDTSRRPSHRQAITSPGSRAYR